MVKRGIEIAIYLNAYAVIEADTSHMRYPLYFANIDYTVINLILRKYTIVSTKRK